MHESPRLLALVAAALFAAAPCAGVQRAPVDGATALTAREQSNAEAVTRLLGIVRFFHPADAVATLDWDSATVATMRAALGARDDAELARRLTSALAGVAPSVVVRAGDVRTAPTVEAPAGATMFTYWLHDGVRLSSASNIYRSRRLVQEWDGGALPDSVPDPRRPLRLALGPQLVAWVPVALWRDASGTLPHTATTAPPWSDSLRALRLRDTSLYSPRDRAVRLADVAIAWAVLDQFYPYFDVVGVDWDAELSRALRDAARAHDACEQRDVLARMVAALHDGHGNVRHPCERLASLPFLATSIGGRIFLTTVDTSVTGARPGDEILAVDGEPTPQRLARLRPTISASTPGHLAFVEAAAIMAGAEADARVALAHPDGTRGDLVLRRSMRAWQLREPRPPVLHEIRPGIWYVNLARLTTAEWDAALPTLEKAAGLVFDMRGYPSGLEPEPFFAHISRDTVRSAQWWVPRMAMPRTGPRSTPLPFLRRESWRIPPLAPYLAAPKVFITDGRAISYAESVMGIVEHYQLGAIVGEATAGTNGNVNPFTLPGGYAVRFSGMRVLKQDGSRHHGVGILPTVPVRRTRAGIVAGRDELLERAIAVVSARATPAGP